MKSINALLPAQHDLADEMLAYLKASPASVGLEVSDDPAFLYEYVFHFEAARNLIVRELMLNVGLATDAEFKILDFGYLSGLTQEFTHRQFPRAQFTVFDHPDSPIFKDPAYQRSIKERGYVELRAMDLAKAGPIPGKYDVIILGEIVEHLDPTTVVRLLQILKDCAAPNALLLVTTLNASGLYNCWMTLTGKDKVQVAPLPDPIHGFGHIHLWSPQLFNETAAYHGWKPIAVKYYHGREGEKFALIRRKWCGVKANILLRGIEWLSNRKPAWKGCFVAAYTAK